MLASFVASLDRTYEEFRAECDTSREQHGEWLRETLERTEKQLLNHMCVRRTGSPEHRTPALALPVRLRGEDWPVVGGAWRCDNLERLSGAPALMRHVPRRSESELTRVRLRSLFPCALRSHPTLDAPRSHHKPKPRGRTKGKLDAVSVRNPLLSSALVGSLHRGWCLCFACTHVFDAALCVGVRCTGGC